MKGKDYNSSITYSPQVLPMNTGKKYLFWEATFEQQNMDDKMPSYNDVDFFFSQDKTTIVQHKYMYRTQTLARIYLELKIILRCKPSLVQQWLSHGGRQVPRIVMPTQLSKNAAKKRNKVGKDQTECVNNLVEGWI
eukprot:9026625-Ditylum_brightwellii.AAC.1